MIMNASDFISWFFGVVIFTLGILNLFQVHPVPGIIYILLSSLFIPQTNKLFRKNVGFTIPLAVKILLGLVIFWFTLGVSDLAEMYGL